MNESKLKNASILLETINNTKESLGSLKKLKEKKENERKKRKLDNKYHDGLYALNIGEHSDMSGGGAKLNRYGGNMELLDIIIITLEKQLKAYEEEFELM